MTAGRAQSVGSDQGDNTTEDGDEPCGLQIGLQTADPCVASSLAS